MKKRYLITVALVLVGLLTFSTFANPNEEAEDNNELLNTNELKEVEEVKQVVQNTVVEEEPEEGIEVQEQLVPAVRQPVIRRQQQNNRVEEITTEEIKDTDNSYEIALAAVEKTEETYEEDDYNTAKALVFHVEEDDKQYALSSRLDDVLESMKLIEQVYELVVKVKDATNKEELISARNYEEVNKIIDKVTSLIDEELKNKLSNNIKDILNKLNDVDAPFINIDKDAILNEITKLDISDISNYTITLTKDGKVLEGIQNGYMMLDGVYELKVVDSSFNETSLQFTIDTTPAVINLAGTVGLNKNEYIVDSGDVVTVEDIMAEVVDNIDGTIKIKPTKAHLLISNIASENKYNYDFTNGFETNYHGRYNLYYEYTDKAGNKTEAVMLLVMKDKVAPTITIKGTEGRNNNELRVNQDDVVTLDDVTALFEDNTEASKEIYPSKITRYYPSETKKASHKYDATNGFDTTNPGYYIIEYSAADKAGNKTTKSMLLVVRQIKLAEVKEGKTALYSNLTLTDDVLFNEIAVDEDIVIDGNGYTVNHVARSKDDFEWIDGGTNSKNGLMFSSKNGELITVKNLNITGTLHAIAIGQYRTPDYANYNTIFENVNITNLKVGPYSGDRANAVFAIGNVELKNVNIYGTTLSPFFNEEPKYGVHDLVIGYYTNVKINGGRIDKIYTLDSSTLKIKDGKIDTIVARGRKGANGSLVIEEGTTVNKIIVKKADTVITIKKGAIVEEIDYENRSDKYIIIEDKDSVKKHTNKK